MNKDFYYKPDFGFSRAIKTQEPCSNPFFQDPHYHRVGWFVVSYHSGKEPGYECVKKCVMCGHIFNNQRMFKKASLIQSNFVSDSITV